MAEGASRGLGMNAMMSELGSAAVGCGQDPHRLGSVQVVCSYWGRMRQAELKQHCLHACVQQGRLNVVKVACATSFADAITKFRDAWTLGALLGPHGIMVAPTARSGQAEGG